MILSLLLATLIFIPVVSYIGILPAGEALFGSSPTLTGAANTTMHNMYSAFGLTAVIPIVVAASFGLAVAVIYCMRKAGLDLEEGGLQDTH